MWSVVGPCRPQQLSSPSGQYGTLFHVLSWSMENWCQEISTLHINAISISHANVILCHFPPESIATLWYYHISFIMVQPHCCMVCLILGHDIRCFSETSVILIDLKVVTRLCDGHERAGSTGAGPGTGLMCDIGVYLFVCWQCRGCMMLRRKSWAAGAGPGMGATVVLVWWENVELICVELTFVQYSTVQYNLPSL